MTPRFWSRFLSRSVGHYSIDNLRFPLGHLKSQKHTYINFNLDKDLIQSPCSAWHIDLRIFRILEIFRKFLKIFDLEFHNFKLEIIIVVESLDNKIYQEKYCLELLSKSKQNKIMHAECVISRWADLKFYLFLDSKIYKFWLEKLTRNQFKIRSRKIKSNLR